MAVKPRQHVTRAFAEDNHAAERVVQTARRIISPGYNGHLAHQIPLFHDHALFLQAPRQHGYQGTGQKMQVILPTRTDSLIPRIKEANTSTIRFLNLLASRIQYNNTITSILQVFHVQHHGGQMFSL